LHRPAGISVRSRPSNHRVRKVSITGAVSTFAGAEWDAIPYDGAFDGPASTATFNTSTQLACDKNGNVYVTDLYNNKIRKITQSGTVSSLAGGDYYHYGHQDGVGSAALFYAPSAIVCDSSGTLYVIDDDGECIRKIKPDGTVTTVLGPSEPVLPGFEDILRLGALAIDKNGNLFISISEGIVKISPDGNIIRYAIGGIGESDGPIPIAAFRNISGIAVDNSGSLYITDNNRVRKIGWQ
jgi:hypothetical protein